MGTELEVRPLTPERWDDLVALFGERGAVGGCWCMFFRLTGGEFQRSSRAATRQGLKDLVDSGAVPGLLAYSQGRPVGWCSVAPRAELPRVLRSPTLRPADERPVWATPGTPAAGRAAAPSCTGARCRCSRRPGSTRSSAAPPPARSCAAS